MTIVKEDTTILPCWREGTIRLLDIAPTGPGQPQLAEGLPISLAYCDLVMRPDYTFADVNGGVFQGVLQKVPGERGGSDFVVEDRLFNAVFPHDQKLPLCLAGYNVSFLHRLLGAPWGERPHQLCLHRLARIYNLGKSSDYSLAELVEYLQPSFEVPWFECEAFTRMMQSRVVLRHLLAESRLNMLAALSVARTPPPPTSEPFGKVQGWQVMEDRVYRDFE
ncbi:hypothetical protein ACLEIY_01230 [Acetobacter tropicalis]|uniref:Uncharacterized protein n=1 Tax=Acetobacter orleanensis TaxID=104099 RepID=A0A4Y3TML6_9PROT|nr:MULTISPECIES: hypothetical protein [Acetobacter]KXV65900.1 hypothetical protein AD949_03860 [Acetobacter orleanensis]PCD79806.1 hypothetical protein CO710_06380 [Acetobacter orleanensis]GAN69923.1 hypothetical protein Abol_247_003 [Acetobacter orleanensis JCM 7639]GBR28610.1 hypothetical protein AA0473_1807 [Acetobacter orleanensis NRIC 0473]GEB83596.1 hypothetical protein AOR01nite_20730 [Acetobacter orleanensis]